MKNVTQKFVNEGANKGLDYLYNANFPIESLIVNIIPNENEFITNHQINLNSNALNLDSELINKIELLLINNVGDKIAFGCFSIAHHFNKDFKNSYTELSFVDLIINIDDDDVTLNIALNNTTYFRDLDTKNNGFTNCFECDKITSIIIKDLLTKENKND